MNRSLLFFLLLSSSFAVTAQRNPISNIYMFQVQALGDSSYALVSPKFLTAFNKRGYNNQPAFINNTDLWLTVQVPYDTTQTEIYSLNLAKNLKTRVTATVESEFSPTPTPDPYYFSCVRVEKNKKQRLWKMPYNRTSEGEPLFPNITNIGYHTWLNDKSVAMFLVGNPHNLVVGNTATQTTTFVSSTIGRCLRTTSDGKLLFVFKATNDIWYIKKYNPATYSSEIVVKTVGGSEDFVLLDDNTLLMGKGSQVFKFKIGTDTRWREVADVRYYGIKSIERLAISSGNKLAMVVK
jgi:hypothetical protein